MNNYTIVKPGFEFIDPPNKNNYLEFLEKCTRVCYKSEDRIKAGSAEKLMTQVVKNYKHFSTQSTQSQSTMANKRNYVRN